MTPPAKDPILDQRKPLLQAGSAIGVGGQDQLEVTSLTELGSQAVDALNLFVDNQDPPAAAAGAGSDSSKRASAASEADSGPTLFPMSTFEIEDRELELEEPFAGPANLEDQDKSGEGAGAPSAVPVDPDSETIPNADATDQGHQTPVVEHSLGANQTAESTDQRNPPIQQSKISRSLPKRTKRCSCRLNVCLSKLLRLPKVHLYPLITFSTLLVTTTSLPWKRNTSRSLGAFRSSASSRQRWRPPQPKLVLSPSLPTSKTVGHRGRVSLEEPLLQARREETEPEGVVVGLVSNISRAVKT